MKIQLMNVPGYTGSGPGHWQSLWERNDPAMQRVVQPDWDRPDVIEWPRNIDANVRASAAPAVLIAHSCGVTAVTLWAERYRTPVAGAFLVAPADPDSAAADANVASFGPVPRSPLPFRSVVVASENDPYCSVARAAEYATAWGSRLVLIGNAGHINTASGHGEWPEGRALLDQFCAELLA